jgi:hypothetical protein
MDSLLKLEFEEKKRIYLKSLGTRMDIPTLSPSSNAFPSPSSLSPPFLSSLHQSSKSLTGSDAVYFPKFLVFDPLYLFSLAFLYLYRYSVIQRFVDPNCISTFASLHSLIPEFKGDVIVLTSVDSMNTAECVSSYKLLISSLKGMCESSEEIKVSSKWRDLDDRKTGILELLNVAISKKGDGMTRAVTYPKNNRLDQNVCFFFFFFSHFPTFLIFFFSI